MRIWVLFSALYLFSIAAKAQQNYDAALIPTNLLTNAGAVIRYSNTTQTVNALNKTTYRVKQAITALNSNGNVNIMIWHNESNIIKYVNGSIYNAKGKLVTEFSERDFSDVYAGQDFSLFEDSRVEHYEPKLTDYPYTVEYEYEVQSTQSMVFHDWVPNAEPGTAVEKSSYSFISKSDFNIHYKEINTPNPVLITSDKHGLKTYSWEVSHLPAEETEPYSPNEDQYLTKVKIAPLQFEYEGLKGTFSNWQELGKWMFDKLLYGRGALAPETVAYIKQLTSGISDPKEKARKIYEYMQHKTRYISIQLGLGGYQPFLATEVDKTGYGDCKALVNYTAALLKAADINSYYCVVQAGSRKVNLMTNFASMDQGDHIILCIPFKNDTTWLECTSQQIPFGFLSSFTDDRLVLACTPDGGKLLHTPHYTAEMNATKRTGNFNIDDKGILSGNMTTTFSGTNFDECDNMVRESHTNQFKDILERYPVNNLTVEKVELSEYRTPLPIATEQIKINANEFASPNSGKYYFKINAFNALDHVPNEVSNRIREVYINRGYTESDEITYTLPAGYHIDKPLLDKKIDIPIGSFSINMKVDNGKLIYKRHLQMKDGTYSKDIYQNLVDFFRAIDEADDYKMAYVKDN